MQSLRGRLLVAGSIPLLCFFLLSAAMLDRALREYARASFEDRLRGVFYGLLSMVDYHPDLGFQVTSALPDPALRAFNTGLFARITLGDGHTVWQSPTFAEAGFRLPPPPDIGQAGFTFVDGGEPGSHAVYTFTAGWEVGPGELSPLNFYVVQEASGYHRQVLRARLGVLTGVLVIGGLLLFIQAVILRRGLAPLRRIEGDLLALEKGQVRRLEGDYPREIGSLADALNDVISGQQEQLERYRNTLSDLAHGLKTPLSVVRAELSAHDIDPTLREEIERQVSRMDELVDYHLRRGRAAGRLLAGEPVNLAALAGQVRDTLHKIHRDRNLHIHVDIPPGLHCVGDRQDLLEVLGNLVENACKWCGREVEVRAAAEAGGVAISVEDDGPGISPADRRRLLGRGERADESAPGHGLGLAIVLDIVELAGGRLEIGDSALGGTAVRVWWPGDGAA